MSERRGVVILIVIGSDVCGERVPGWPRTTDQLGSVD